MGREVIPESGIDPAALIQLIPTLFGNKTNQSQTQTQVQKATVDPDILASVKNMIAQLTGESTNPHNDLIDSILQKSAINFAPTRALENQSGGYNSTTLKLLQDNARGEATSQAVQAVLTAQRQAADTAARLGEGALNATRSVSQTTTTNGTTQQKGSIVPLAASVAAGSIIRRLTGGKNSVTTKDLKNAGEPILNKFGKFSPRQEEYAAGSDAQFEPSQGGSLGSSSGGAGTSAGAFSFGDSSSGAAYTSDALEGAPAGSFLTSDDIAASIEMATQNAAGNAALLHTGTSASVADTAANSTMTEVGQAQPQQAQLSNQIEQPAYANAPQVKAGPAEEEITGRPLRDPTNDPIVKSGATNYDNVINGATLAAPLDNAGGGLLNSIRPTPNMSIVPGTEPTSLFPHAEPNMSLAPASFLRGGDSAVGSSAVDDMVVPGIGGSAAPTTVDTPYGDFGGVGAAENLANTTPADYGDFGGASLGDNAANQISDGALSGTGQIPILGPALQVAAGEPGNAGANIAVTYGLTSIGIPFPVAAFVGQNLAAPVNDAADDIIRGLGDFGKQTGDLVTDLAKNSEDFLSKGFDSIFGSSNGFGDAFKNVVDDFSDFFSI